MTLTIGVTGGIGCGKSSATRQFETLGAAVVDTDVIAHALTQPGQPALRRIADAFGREYLRADGSFDRARMRERIFSDDTAKARLEGILHPMIREEAGRQLAACRAPYALLVVPLMLETGTYLQAIDRLLVVDCAEETQIERVMRRSGLAADAVRAIMARQANRAERLARADDVLDNGGSPEALARQVEALHARYLELAAEVS